MRGGHATPADRSDTEEFVTVLDEVGIRAGESVYADKGYSEPQTCWLPVGWVILPFSYVASRQGIRVKFILFLFAP